MCVKFERTNLEEKMNSGNPNNPFSFHPMVHWNNGCDKPDLRFNRRLMEMNQENRELDSQINELQTEVKLLEIRLNESEDQAAAKKKCLQKLSSWLGVEVEAFTPTSCIIGLPVIIKGKTYSKYEIGFHKFGPCWSVSFYSLPDCMRLIPQRVEEAKLDSLEKLATMIRELQYETDLFVRREIQFKEAMSLSSRTLRIYPSKSTLFVLLEIDVNDNEKKSDLSAVTVSLTYRNDSYLPELPHFKFTGGDNGSQAEMKRQLGILQHVPLKDALLSAFCIELKSDKSAVNEEDNEDLPVEPAQNSQSLNVSIESGKSTTPDVPKPSTSRGGRTLNHSKVFSRLASKRGVGKGKRVMRGGRR